MPSDRGEHHEMISTTTMAKKDHSSTVGSRSTALQVVRLLDSSLVIVE